MVNCIAPQMNDIFGSVALPAGTPPRFWWMMIMKFGKRTDAFASGGCFIIASSDSLYMRDCTASLFTARLLTWLFDFALLACLLACLLMSSCLLS